MSVLDRCSLWRMNKFIMVASWFSCEWYKATINKTIHVFKYMWAINLVGENHSVTAFHCIETRWLMGHPPVK